MLELLNENKEWIFSGIGIAILSAIFGIAKHKSGFKLTFHFYKLLFIATVLTLGCDYIFNYDGDWRLRLFIFGLMILLVYNADLLISYIKRRNSVKKAVRMLSMEDCEYVVRCYECDEYFKFEGSDSKYIEFSIKWDNVLHIPMSKMVEMLRTPYKIYAYSYAYKLAKKDYKK